MSTPNLGLRYIVAGQAQKEVTHNEALSDLDALAQISVIDRSLNAPPGSPAMGDTYIVAGAPTGAWSGAAGKIAAYFSGWRIKMPVAGWLAWARGEGRLLVYGGSGWGNLVTPFLEGSLSWSPGSVGAGVGVGSSAISVGGAAFGDFVQVAAPYDLQGVTATAFVSSAGNVTIRLQNGTGGAVSLGAGNWRVRVHKQ